MLRFTIPGAAAVLASAAPSSLATPHPRLRATPTTAATQGGIDEELVPFLLTDLAAVHPFGIPAGFVSSADGLLLLSGEGASVAFVDATNDTTFKEYIKRVQVGKQGVMPSALLLDPDAEDNLTIPGTPYVPGSNDYVYIAGGRAGLWIMEADPRVGIANLAARIDDSGNSNPITQKSRRWWWRTFRSDFSALLQDG